MSSPDPPAIHQFWFRDSLEGPEGLEKRKSDWFGSGDLFDDEIRRRYGDLPDRADAGEFDHWQDDASSTISLILVLDQFPRNIFRGTARSFAYDAKACRVAKAAVERGVDKVVHPLESIFIYLPFEHGETADDQDISVDLFESLVQKAPADLKDHFESAAEYARQHRDIVNRFGRFPHRNLALGRSPTSAEQEFLDSGGDTFGVPQHTTESETDYLIV